MTETARPLLWSIAAASGQLGGLGRSAIYELVKDGRLHVVHLGRRAMIADNELQRFVAALAGEEGDRR